MYNHVRLSQHQRYGLMIYSDPHNLLSREDEIPTKHTEPLPSTSTELTQTPQQTQEPQQTERTGRAWPSVSAISSLGSVVDPLDKL